MNLSEQELKMLAELLTGGIKDEACTADPIKFALRASLMSKGLAEFAKDFGWAEQPQRNFLLITPKGRAAYSAWANRNNDGDDAKEDSQAQADPGPVFRMVTHIKEAGMIAFRFGHNSARAQQPNAIVGAKEALRITLERALGKVAEPAVIEAFTTFLQAQMDKGIEAAKNVPAG